MPASKKRKKRRQGTNDDSFLRSVSTYDLQNEIFARENKMARLVKKRDKLIRQVARIDSQIQQGSISSSVTKQKSEPVQEQKLFEILVSILQDKKMKLAEMEKAVKETGYKTKSKDFSNVIYQCIKDHRSNFRRVSRGVYTTKGVASKGE